MGLTLDDVYMLMFCVALVIFFASGYRTGLMR